MDKDKAAALLKRKSHSKSRNGCRNCKKRHVKCDEQGPPCLNCVVRDTQATCTYAQPPPAASSSSMMARPGSRSDQLSTDGGSSSSSMLSPAPAPAPSSAAAAEARRLMDVELMHRWSTITYQSFVTMPQDREYLQVQVPLEAFRTEYMLNGLLALTAIEKALADGASVPASDGAVSPAGSTGGGGTKLTRAAASRYIRVAIEYYGRCIVGFRDRLANMAPGDQHALYFTSILAVLINLLLPRCTRILMGQDDPAVGSSGGGGDEDGDDDDAHTPDGLAEPVPDDLLAHRSAIAQALAAVDLLNGTSSISTLDWGGMVNSACGPSITAALSLGVPPIHDLDESTDGALKALMALAAATGPSPPPFALAAPAEAVFAAMDFSALVDGRITGALPAATPSAVTLDANAAARTPAEIRRDMYMNATFYLRYSFAEASRAAYRFSGVGWPAMVGREFREVLAAREPLALLMVAFWGALLARKSNAVWWMGSIPRDLVAETTEALVLLELRGQLGDDGFAGMKEWRACVSWVRREIGLTAL